MRRPFFVAPGMNGSGIFLTERCCLFGAALDVLSDFVVAAWACFLEGGRPRNAPVTGVERCAFAPV